MPNTGSGSATFNVPPAAATASIAEAEAPVTSSVTLVVITPLASTRMPSCLALVRPAATSASSVMVTEAYQEFLCYCQLANLKNVEFKEFKRIARELILERYQLGFRHDLRTAEGRQTHGWKHIRLLPESAARATEAA